MLAESSSADRNLTKSFFASIRISQSEESTAFWKGGRSCTENRKQDFSLARLAFALPGVPGEIPTIRLLLATDCSTSSGCPAGLTQKTAEISNRFMLASGYDPASLGIQTDDIFVLSRDGVQIPVTLYSEYGSDGHSPCLLYFHGGGFCTKTSPQYERLMSEYAAGAHCRVIFVHYRTSDRHLYPIPFNDCVDVLSSIVQNPSRYGINPQRIILGGDSAGGCLASGAALWCRDHQIPIRMQFLIYPMTDCRMQTKTDRKYWDAPLWNSPLSRRMWQIYLRKGIDEKHPGYASIQLENDLSDLVPAYIEVQKYDSLRDDGTEYADRLKEAGIPVELTENAGSIHGFDVLFWTDLSRTAMKKRIAALRREFAIDFLPVIQGQSVLSV